MDYANVILVAIRKTFQIIKEKAVAKLRKFAIQRLNFSWSQF